MKKMPRQSFLVSWGGREGDLGKQHEKATSQEGLRQDAHLWFKVQRLVGKTESVWEAWKARVSLKMARGREGISEALGHQTRCPKG